MTSNRSIERHFSRAAEAYHQLARVQQQAAEQLAAAVAELGLAPRRVLDIGCGTGFLTRRMLLQFPVAELVALDLSPGMIEVARQQVPASASLEFVVAEAMEYQPTEPFDLVVSSSTLQWLQPFDRLFAKLHSMLAPGGHVCASIMLHGTLGELHSIRSDLFPALAPAQLLPESESVLASLEQCGFEVLAHQVQEDREWYATPSAALRSMREQGFTGGPLSTGRRPLTRGQLAALLSEYEQRYTNGTGRVPVSFRHGMYLAKRC